MALLSAAYVPDLRPTFVGHTARRSGQAILRLVPDLHRDGKVKQATFFAVLAGILVTGLMSLLILNTMLAHDSFALHKLQKEARQLKDDEQAMRLVLDRMASPTRLAERATKLGMVPGADSARFIRISPEGTR
jgi:hypothetical protein